MEISSFRQCTKRTESQENENEVNMQMALQLSLLVVLLFFLMQRLAHYEVA